MSLLIKQMGFIKSCSLAAALLVAGPTPAISRPRTEIVNEYAWQLAAGGTCNVAYYLNKKEMWNIPCAGIAVTKRGNTNIHFHSVHPNQPLAKQGLLTTYSIARASSQSDLTIRATNSTSPVDNFGFEGRAVGRDSIERGSCRQAPATRPGFTILQCTAWFRNGDDSIGVISTIAIKGELIHEAVEGLQGL